MEEKILIGMGALIFAAVMVLWIIPAFFTWLVRRWYRKNGTGITRSSMYYDADKGKICGRDVDIGEDVKRFSKD